MAILRYVLLALVSAVLGNLSAGPMNRAIEEVYEAVCPGQRLLVEGIALRRLALKEPSPGRHEEANAKLREALMRQLGGERPSRHGVLPWLGRRNGPHARAANDPRGPSSRRGHAGLAKRSGCLPGAQAVTRTLSTAAIRVEKVDHCPRSVAYAPPQFSRAKAAITA